jgi:TolA-binding protein
MDRQTRRDLKHDKFVDEVGALSSRARDNQRLLLTIAVVAVVIAVAIYGIYFYRTTREQKAQDTLAQGIEAMDSPLVATAPGQPTMPNAKYHTEAERTAAAEKFFKDVQTTYSGSSASDVANLYLARIQAGKGDAKAARTLLEQFVNEHPKNVLAQAARYDLYQLRIENGEAQQVSNELDQELKKTDNQVLPPDAMLAILAHAYEAQGSPDKSREQYRRIITEFPESAYVLEAQRRVGGAA